MAIAENYGKEPTRPLDVAAALEMSPTSGPFRTLCGAAIGYGLTEGGPNAAQISLTPLGLRFVAPLETGEDTQARRDAVLNPTVVRAFLEKYDGSPLPPRSIGMNVLETMDVPAKSTERVYDLIVDSAESVGYLKTIKDKQYVDLGLPVGQASDVGRRQDANVEAPSTSVPDIAEPTAQETELPPPAPFVNSVTPNRKVFVTHGSSLKVVEQLKQLLTYGDFEPIVSVQRESVSKSITDKVLDDMRGCAAAIIHVRPEERLLDSAGEERPVLNENVLIEVGAALALYGQNFILLVEDGTSMPSNLKGLYEVRYTGDELGFDATMKVMKALNGFKNPST